MYPAPLYRHLASLVEARANCVKSGNTEWLGKHSQHIAGLCREYLPSGAGIDGGCSLDLSRSNAERLVITTSFHHMNDHGSYVGWTDHSVIITPSFEGIAIRITGRDVNSIKQYLQEVFAHALYTEVSANALYDSKVSA